LAQEFVIKSNDIENKINQLLPSQGGFQAGVDFSASTMVVPIVDLTETAEGSNVRIDLQTALSFNDVTSHAVSNTTTTIINTTGYFRVFGCVNAGASDAFIFQLSDGVSTKDIAVYSNPSTGSQITPVDFIVFLGAGDSLIAVSQASLARFQGCTKQIADINGALTTPS